MSSTEERCDAMRSRLGDSTFCPCDPQLTVRVVAGASCPRNLTRGSGQAAHEACAAWQECLTVWPEEFLAQVRATCQCTDATR